MHLRELSGLMGDTRKVGFHSGLVKPEWIQFILHWPTINSTSKAEIQRFEERGLPRLIITDHDVQASMKRNCDIVEEPVTLNTNLLDHDDSSDVHLCWRYLLGQSHRPGVASGTDPASGQEKRRRICLGPERTTIGPGNEPASP
jgi:hypothetical protein